MPRRFAQSSSLGLIAALSALAAPPAWSQPAGPAIRITTPTQGQAISGACTIVVEAPSASGIDHITLYRNGEPIGNDFSAPYEFPWDTRWDPEGPTKLVAKATGEGFIESVSPEVTVVIDHTPPKVTVTAPVAGGTLGGVIELRAQATDTVGMRSLRFLVNGQDFAELKSPPYTASWDTFKGPNGQYALEARAFDTAGNSALSPSVTVRIANPNHPPILDKIGSKTVSEGQPLSFAISAHDPEEPRDTVTVTAENLPPWVVFNPKTRMVYGTPASSEASLRRPMRIYPGVRFQACDPEPLCVSEEITIQVSDVNRPPSVAALGDRTINEGQLLSFVLIKSDPDGDPLTCKAEHLPPWLVFDDLRCSAEGTPDFEVASLEKPIKTYPTTRFTVCDPGELCAKAQTVITVMNVDTRPRLAPVAPQVVDEGRPLRVEITAKDANGDLITMTAQPLPEGAVFDADRKGHGQLTWTPRMDQAGEYEVGLSATDGEMVDEAKLRVTVKEISLAISGLVMDGVRNVPLKEAEISIMDGGKEVRKIRTGSDGFFLADGLKNKIRYVVKPHLQVVEQFSPKARGPAQVKYVPDRYEFTLAGKDHTHADFAISVHTGRNEEVTE